MNRLYCLFASAAAVAGCALTAFADTGYSHRYEWLESDGTQVIDLGVKPESDTMVFLTFALCNTKGRRLFGAHDGTDGVLLGVSGNWMASPTFENTDTPADDAVGRPYTFRIQIATPYLSKGGYQFENHALTARYGSTTTSTADCNYYVFGSNKSGEIEGKSDLRLYSVVIYASDWQVLHDFRPASRGGEYGLVDRVTGEFRGNIVAGANAFAVGGEVETGAGSLTIATDPKNLPVALQPSAGTVDTLAIGETIPVSAPALPYATDEITATCTGWTLYSWNADSGSWVEETDRENHSGAGTSFTYTHMGTASKLVWHYAVTNPTADPGTTYRYVWNANGSDAAAVAGASWTTPYYSVAAAIAAAKAGDVILVGPGVYKLNGELTVNKSVTIRGAAGKEVTELNGQEFCRCMTIKGSATTNPVVEELTFRKGKSKSQKDGGGVSVDYGTLRRCIVTDNEAGGRGGGLAIDGFGLVSQCSISSNRETICWGGVGVVMSGDSILEHSLVFDNVNWKDGVADDGGPGGGIRLQSGNPTVRSCTIYGNCGTTGGGIYNNVDDSAKIHDCIVWGNLTTSDTSEGAPNWYGTGSKITNVFSSVAWGVKVGDREFVGDPGFVDAANYDFHLKDTSPCRDASWGPATVETDVYGAQRVQGDAMDVGAVENSTVSITYEKTGELDACTVDFTANANGFDIASATCYWTFDGRTPTANDYDAVGLTVQKTYGAGTHSAALTVIRNGRTYKDSLIGFLTVVPSKVYVVVENEYAEAPYDTWAKAATNVNDAIEVAAEKGTTIFVSNGVHHVSKAVAVNKQLTLKSMNGPSVTTITADGKDRVLIQSTNNSTVAGFTLTGGYSRSDGGGVNISGGVLTNCIVCGNRAVNNAVGGGLFMGGSALVTGCVVSNNTIDVKWWGAGVYLNGGTIENSLICNNRNYSSSVDFCGGGIAVSQRGTIRNCTVVGNSAGSNGNGGGIYWQDTSGSIINTIVWGNTGAAGKEDLGGESGSPTPVQATNVCSSVAVGVNTSKNSLVGDPLFQDAENGNYRLRIQSPCRNAAWGKPTTAVDLDGKRRVVGHHMDIGCYECDLPVGTLILIR